MVFEIDITNAKGLSFGLCSPEKMEGGAAKHRRYYIKMHAQLIYNTKLEWISQLLTLCSASNSTL